MKIVTIENAANNAAIGIISFRLMLMRFIWYISGVVVYEIN